MARITPQTKDKPWGGFEQFIKNKKSTVKILTIDPHQKISLQTHKKRREFWKVLKGPAIITLKEKKIEAQEGGEFVIPKETKHRLEAKDNQVKVLEISLGEFDKNDINRLKDKYERNK